MHTRETSQTIDDAAAAWAVRLDRGTLAPDEQSLFDNWLSADPRHFGAFAKAQAVLLHTERARALGPSFDPERFGHTSHEKRVIPRRTLLVGGIAAAGAAAVFIPRLLTSPKPLLFTTKLGETRAVRLEDGSVVTMNTASAIAVSYSARRRNVALLQGEGLFDVAKDPARPFTVKAGFAEVRAVGTSFAVVILPKKPIGILVREGVVELNRTNLPSSGGVRVPANTRVVASQDAPLAVMAVSAEDLNRELIWREGQIAFEGSTLKEAAEAFARYSAIRVVITDPAVAQKRITGLFQTDDPVRFAKAVSLSLGLQVRVAEQEVLLGR